jgi:hypothetical protein
MDGGDSRAGKQRLPSRDDYLWDGSGEPDPEIQRLEGLLGRFQYDRRTPVLPEIARVNRWAFIPRWMRLVPALAATGVAVLALVTVIFLLYRRKPVPVTGAGWDVSRVAGTPRIGRNTIGGKKASRLGVGQILETDHQSRASLRADEIGQIEVEPSTRVRLLAMGTGLEHIALDRGTIHTYIWAPPGQFVVDTPSAVTVDLVALIPCRWTIRERGLCAHRSGGSDSN